MQKIGFQGLYFVLVSSSFIYFLSAVWSFCLLINFIFFTVSFYFVFSSYFWCLLMTGRPQQELWLGLLWGSFLVGWDGPDCSFMVVLLALLSAWAAVASEAEFLLLWLCLLLAVWTCLLKCFPSFLGPDL